MKRYIPNEFIDIINEFHEKYESDISRYRWSIEF